MYATSTLVVEKCCVCGCAFAMEDGFRRNRLNHPGEAFYCPAGHVQHYTGETDAQKQQKRAERAERAARMAREEAEASARSGRALRGHLTRLKRRVASGQCPCCHDRFEDLAEHMADAHPGYENPSGEEES